MSDPDDLDALVTELNAAAPRRAGRPGDQASARRSGDSADAARLQMWLDEVVARSASDLLLVAGAPPSVRIDGIVEPLPPAFGGPLDSEEIQDAVLPALPPHARRMYRESGIADGSYRDGEHGRFRINLHHERG